jgi:hypothetical protein
MRKKKTVDASNAFPIVGEVQVRTRVAAGVVGAQIRHHSNDVDEVQARIVEREGLIVVVPSRRTVVEEAGARTRRIVAVVGEEVLPLGKDAIEVIRTKYLPLSKDAIEVIRTNQMIVEGTDPDLVPKVVRVRAIIRMTATKTYSKIFEREI